LVLAALWSTFDRRGRVRILDRLGRLLTSLLGWGGASCGCMVAASTDA